ncbi:hypothetical protein PENTCL1PPCAC_30647 [Pristionchus entomophagus]|uniref:Uncharacterized protein n=1 Tax=Pristionchus entomophagus TaxID=358040 RepID=A0AAV5UQE5_9BILA|nr:hypothetical protein PENTCL1PPCAC_30647 [Pristionchus entomophagus]
MERGGYYPSSSGVAPLGTGAYINEQPATAPPHIYFGAPPPDMQQCYPPQSAGYFPNDPHYAWAQQNQQWQMMRHQPQPVSGFIPPRPLHHPFS